MIAPTTSLSVTNTGLEAKDVLANALVLESLIFVAFSFSLALARPTRGGRHPFFALGVFAWLVVLVIATVGAAAGAAWWTLYHIAWPNDTVSWIQAGGLAVGIVAQPLFAAVIATQTLGTPPSS